MNQSDGRLIAVCVSAGGIPRIPVAMARVSPQGIEGDGHRFAEHYIPQRAVTLFSQEMLDRLAPTERPFSPGAVGENLTLGGIDLRRLTIGAEVTIGLATLRLEKPWIPCYAKDQVTGRVQPNRDQLPGFFASVVQDGVVRPGDPVQVHSG